jgi:hypothetical protein
LFKAHASSIIKRTRENENITKVKKTRKRKEHQGAKNMDVQ